MKKLLSLLLAVILCFSALSVGGLASGEAEEGSASGICGVNGDNLTWELDAETGVLTISGTGAMSSYLFYGTAPWYSRHALIQSVVIADGVTSIGNWAFYGCGSLTSVTIPNSVTSIGRAAFQSCRSLQSVTIPDSVAYIEMQTFESCRSLTSVTIPNGVIEINYDAFRGCTSLQSVTIPNSVLGISADAFDLCESLTEVHYLGTEAEWNEITIWNADESDSELLNAERYYEPAADETGGKVYSGECGENVTWTLDTGVGVLMISGAGEMYSFYNPFTYSPERTPWDRYRASITSAVIEPGVTSIGDGVFNNLIYLTNVTIPDGVTSIGNSSFEDCRSLTSVTIPDGVTFIGDGAFSGCTGMTSVTIPDSVTIIGSGAFIECTSLTSVTIPESVTSISWFVFADCTGLASITIPAGVTSIDRDAFSNCTGLTDVYYGGTEEEWSSISVDRGDELLLNARIHFSGDEPAVTLSEDGKSARVTGDTSGLYARVALTLYNSGNGESGLYIAPCAIEADGSIKIPEFDLPGLGVTGVSVALVESIEDITAKAFKPVSMDYRYF